MKSHSNDSDSASMLEGSEESKGSNQSSKPLQKKLDGLEFVTFHQRPDVIVKSLFRGMRKYYIWHFYKSVSYKKRTKKDTSIFNRLLQEYIRENHLNKILDDEGF